MRNDIRSLLLLLLLFVSNINVNAFGTTIGRCHGHLKTFRSSGCFYTSSSSSSALYAKNKKNRKSGKGFGAAEQSQSKPVAVDTPVVESSSSVSPTITTSVQEPVKNAGQMALERLEAEERKKKDEELRRVREMRDVDQAVKGDVNAAVIPEKVAQRMTKRMLPFVGIPLFGVMGVLGVLWRNQANGLKETEDQLNDLRVEFAEAKGTSAATNRTIFATLEEMKEAIHRIENHLLAEK